MRKIKRLLKICIPSLYSKEAALLGAHFSFLVLRTLLTIRAQRLNAQYLTSAIARASWETWAKWIAHFGVWMGIGTVTNIGLKYLETNIAASLRSRLTRHVHRLYCSSSGDGAMALPSFYRANRATAAGGMDDAAKGGIDQVIAADIKEWATNAASFYGHSFQPILEFVLSLRACTASLGTLRPMLLFLTQAVTSVAIRGLLSPPTTKMIVSEREAEGTFRASHARLIAHAESVAFLGGARAEHTLLDATFAKLDRLVRLHALRNMQRSLASNILKFQPLLVGGIFVHVPFLLLKGLDPATRISQFRSTEILMLRCGSAFADCIMLGRNLAELEGHTKRVGELVERLEAMEASGGGRDRRSGGAIGDDDTPLLDLANLTVFAGQNENEKRMLIENLSLTIPRGAHTMITGPNGCGKTSLFRVIAGLWSPAEGAATTASGCSVMMLPQTSYLANGGTLLDQIIYPLMSTDAAVAKDRAATEARALRCLADVKLARLAEGSDGLGRTHAEWDDVLSGGERQRIGFARVFFHAPDLVLLDEATSAINTDMEQALYARLVRGEREDGEGGATIISIAHRLELQKFHERTLKIKGDGSGVWELN